ncbi:hypothetical protein GJ688_02095 [Heliobacillus mobilis]|uniref:Uncharacterized protein n=1 Tax=Heliobacterium mobile TaxID=28064 RepID=A0A6I3SG51_HELMO|nr:hypothetical protein [Heliobacterium mobile]MTV47774.1 hypothetical protein [Heliobacterium mobile]
MQTKTLENGQVLQCVVIGGAEIWTPVPPDESQIPQMAEQPTENTRIADLELALADQTAKNETIQARLTDLELSFADLVTKGGV